MGFNWQKYEAWRKHPMLQTRLSSAVSEKTSLAEPRRRGNAGHARRLLPLALLAGTTEACRTARLSLSLSRARSGPPPAPRQELDAAESDFDRLLVVVVLFLTMRIAGPRVRHRSRPFRGLHDRGDRLEGRRGDQAPEGTPLRSAAEDAPMCPLTLPARLHSEGRKPREVPGLCVSVAGERGR